MVVLDRKQLRLPLIMAVCLCTGVCGRVNAAYRIVTDPSAFGIVTQNSLVQQMVESRHNKSLDSVSSKQEKILKYATTMATIKEVYKISMENIKGFGVESKYYIEIGLTAYEIVKEVPKVVKNIKNANVYRKALCIKELTELVERSEHLVSDFVNIVNNGKVENPLKKNDPEKKNDGYNFLNRSDRLGMAIRIYTDLLEMKYKVMALSMMSECATWGDLFFSIDPEGWANVMTARNSVDFIISSWKTLK